MYTAVCVHLLDLGSFLTHMNTYHGTIHTKWLAALLRAGASRRHCSPGVALGAHPVKCIRHDLIAVVHLATTIARIEPVGLVGEVAIVFRRIPSLTPPPHTYSSSSSSSSLASRSCTAPIERSSRRSTFAAYSQCTHTSLTCTSPLVVQTC